jgi:hypothetical protein
MFIATQDLVFTSAATSSVGLEADVLKRLRAAIQQFVRGNLQAAEFDALLADYDLAFWRELQQDLPLNTQACADVACALAYLGEDYEANWGRILWPYHVFKRDAARYARRHAADPDAARLEDLPGYLVLLYRKRRRSDTLATLLELDLKGHAAYLEYVSALAMLWEYNAGGLLDSASQNRLRWRGLTRAIVTLCRIVDEPTVWHGYFRDLQGLIYGRDRRLTWHVHRLQALLTRAQRSITVRRFEG